MYLLAQARLALGNALLNNLKGVLKMDLLVSHTNDAFQTPIYKNYFNFTLDLNPLIQLLYQPGFKRTWKHAPKLELYIWISHACKSRIKIFLWIGSKKVSLMSATRKSIVNTPSIVDMLRGVGTDFRLGMQQNNFRGRKFVFCTIFLSPKGGFPQILGKHCLPCPPTCVRRPWISIRIGVCIKEKVGRHFQFMHILM